MRALIITSCYLIMLSACAPRSVRDSQGSPAGAVWESTVIRSEDIYQTLSYLTSDSLSGRMAGTPENREATRYLAERFGEYGLKPYFEEGYIQTFYTDRKDSANTTSNVIGYLPGRSRPGEMVIISAHFDHVQAGRPSPKDKIYNGANDNASGTAVLLAMAKYYALTANNERSLLFCAFNGEEAGLLGSFDLAQKLPADSITAVINLEMLGVPQYGVNSFFITGMNRSDLARIIRENLEGKPWQVKKERGEDLFERSDNYPFAMRGVPAHSLMASDDREKCYHRPCDELSRIDVRNMARLAEGIIWGISSIVEGKATPKRISHQ